MKNPISHTPIVIILTATLLLSQCAPNIAPPQQVAGILSSPASHRSLVSISPETPHPAEIFFNGIWAVRSENELLPIATEELASNDPDDWNVPQLSPVVVTASTYPDDIVENWPSNVVDAELKSSWISQKEPQPSPRNPTEDSAIEWIRSLR